MGGAAHERLLAAHLCEGETVDDVETLVRLGVEAGLDGTEARRALESGAYTDEVAADVAEARRIGVSGVPFFVLDGTYGVSGAQPVDTFLHALRTAGAARGPA